MEWSCRIFASVGYIRLKFQAEGERKISSGGKKFKKF